jgi:hypothetical protein
MADIRVENHGSIVLLHAVTPAAHTWLVEHTPDDAPWFGDALAVEPRYVGDILNGAREDGLEIE